MTSEGPPLTVSRETSGPATILVLVGELDPASAPVLDAEINAVLGGGATELIIDMAGLSFIDSSGLRSLIRAQKQFDPTVVVLRGPTAFARQLLLITGLDQRFRIDPEDLEGS